MAQTRRHPDDRFMRYLESLQKRVRRIEAPSQISIPLYGYPPNATVTGTGASYAVAQSFLCATTHSRLAYMLEHKDSTGAGHDIRVTARDSSGVVIATLDSFSNANTGLVTRNANVEIPEDVQDGQGWNIAVEARASGGATWTVNVWGLVLTNDPDFTLTKGGA